MRELRYRAWISWLTPKKGGRAVVPTGRHRVDVRFEQDNWPAEGWTLVVEAAPPFDGRRLQSAKIDFLVEDAPHQLLVAGARFELLDGRRVVANGVIVDAHDAENVSEAAVGEVLWV